MAISDDLLKKANMEKDYVRSVLAQDFILVIHTLRDKKGFTWKEIEKWFEKQGLPFSESALHTVYRKWLKRNK